MLAKNDIEWLATTYPHLIPSSDGKELEGVVQFNGAYDASQNKFTLIGTEDDVVPNGVVLSGAYSIIIRESNSSKKLPKLFVLDDTLPHIASRHFYPRDESACVCGVIEEARFLKGGFCFRLYLERLVIPFLYGQKYYDRYGVWPWQDYSHDTAGALESYSFNGVPEFIPAVIDKLRALPDWNRVKAILLSKNQPKGHLPCFCPKHDHIRRCHPDALQGVRKLYADVKEHGFKVE